MHIDHDKGVIIFDNLTRPDPDLIGATKPVIAKLPDCMRNTQDVELRKIRELGRKVAKKIKTASSV